MNRRGFIKVLGIVSALTVLPSVSMAESSCITYEGSSEFDCSLQRELVNSYNSANLEYNDSITRKVMEHRIADTLDKYWRARKIHSYRVICDESNNTPEIINVNNLVVTVIYKNFNDTEYKFITLER